MKKQDYSFLFFPILSILLVVVYFLTHQTYQASIEDVIQSDDWIMQVLTFVTSLKGLGAWAVAAGGTQLAMYFFETPLAAFAGKFRLLAVAVLNCVFVLLGGFASGANLWHALAQAPMLIALQVLVDQIHKQFVEKANEPIQAILKP